MIETTAIVTTQIEIASVSVDDYGRRIYLVLEINGKSAPGVARPNVSEHVARVKNTYKLSTGQAQKFRFALEAALRRSLQGVFA